MSRKRGKKQKAVMAPIPDDVLAEGSGPVPRVDADAIATVEDVVTTEDIATTDDVVTADDVVATDEGGRWQVPLAPEHPDPGDGQRAMTGRDDAIEAADAVDVDAVDLDAADVDAADVDAVDRDAADVDAAGVDAAGAMNGGAKPRVVRATADETGLDASGSETLADLADVDPEADSDDGNGECDDVIVFPTSAATMDAVQIKHLVEALIFASDRPLTVQRLRQLTRVGDVRRLEQALSELSDDYRERGLILQQVSGGYQFRTRTQFSAWVQQLIAGRPVRLSRAQLETLAIIAYRQPITRPEIDDIRGVDSSATLKLLIDRMLIRVLGKREEVGRPILYGTTKEFLDFFSLGDLRELPTLREYSELTAESRKVMSDRLGIAPEGHDGSNGDGSGGSDDGGEGGGSSNEGGNNGGNGSGNGGGGPVPGFGDGVTPAGAASERGDGAMRGLGDGAMTAFGDGSMSAFDDGSIASDDDAVATASAMDLADAVAPFLSPVDTVDDDGGDAEVRARRVESVVE